MVQADPRLNASLASGREHITVMRDRCRVVPALLRFKPRPVDREPVMAQTQASQQTEVFAVPHGEPVAVAG
jgi:hypothetical protein